MHTWSLSYNVDIAKVMIFMLSQIEFSLLAILIFFRTGHSTPLDDAGFIPELRFTVHVVVNMPYSKIILSSFLEIISDQPRTELSVTKIMTSNQFIPN